MKSTLNTTSCHSELVSESPAVSEKIGRPSLKGNPLGLNKFRVTNFYAFTLVELIVVITILVILGTIAFVSLSGYSGSARDGSRVSDLANLSKALDITSIKTGSYPTPDNSFSVTYSGWVLWYQGTIGDSVTNMISANGAKMSKKPTDPLNTAKEYTYSKLAYGNGYQIKSDWEGDTMAYLPSSSGLTRGSNLAESRFVPNGSFGWIPAFAGMTNIGISQAQAASGNPTLSYIKGTYNGVVARTETGTTKYVLAIPSLFLNSGTGTVILPTTSTGFHIHGQTNSGGILFQPNMVFSSGSLPSTDPERQALATSIANAYSGTSLASQSNIQPFIAAINPVNATTLASLGGSAVTNWLGGSTSTTQTPPVATTTFTLSQTSVVAGTSVTITHNCTTPPTSYNSSDTNIATISTNTITTLTAGTTTITPVGGNCTDSAGKVLTVTTVPSSCAADPIFANLGTLTYSPTSIWQAWTYNASNTGPCTYTCINGYSGDSCAIPPFTCGTSTVSDIDGNSYNTISMGSQCWMATNLRTTKNPDGSAITKWPSAHWAAGWTTDSKYYSCPPNSTNNGEDCASAPTYGMLYQWSAAMNTGTTNITDGGQGICPNGWHVPTNTQWKTLVESQATTGCDGGTGAGAWECSPAGSKLAGSAANWTDGALEGTGFGTSGFNVQPSGHRGTDGGYYGRANDTGLWSSTALDASSAWLRYFYYSMPSVYRGTVSKAFGFSLRCLKD